MSHSVQAELIESIDAIRQCISENMSCKHPPEDGSDDPCSGEDCIKCYVLTLANAVSPDERTAPAPASPLDRLVDAEIAEGVYDRVPMKPEQPPVTAQMLHAYANQLDAGWMHEIATAVRKTANWLERRQ